MLARRAARDRSVAEPLFGIAEGKEGVLQGLGANEDGGVVFEMEYRRRSGRGVRETYFLSSPSSRLTPAPPSPGAPAKQTTRDTIILLEDHPLFRTHRPEDAGQGNLDKLESTFEMGLTEKQRKDREVVVLPYLDAQRGEGFGEGGRILYDMGVEDDFDEEEDEI